MFTSLKNHLLIAMPSLLDPHFFRSVTYLCEHTENGAIGIVINHPFVKMRLGDILEQMGFTTSYPEIAERLIFNGGPLQKERGFILHGNDSTWECTLPISKTISLTTSPDVLQAISQNQGPVETLVAVGLAEWGKGQLEKEMSENAWLYAPADSDILFHMAVEQRWRAAAALMGVDVDRLSSDIGHA